MTNGVDDTLSHRVDESRSVHTREWEIFVRSTASEPLRHVGSVSSPTEQGARDRASQFFDATAIWLCPADEVRRYTGSDLTLGDSG